MMDRAGRVRFGNGLVFLVVLVVAVVGSCLLFGCKVVTKNNSELGFRWGTEFTLFHRTPGIVNETAESGVEAPALVDWIMKPPQAEPVEGGVSEAEPVVEEGGGEAP